MRKLPFIFLAAAILMAVPFAFSICDADEECSAETFDSDWSLNDSRDILLSGGTPLFSVSVDADKNVRILGVAAGVPAEMRMNVVFPTSVAAGTETYTVKEIADFAFSGLSSWPPSPPDSRFLSVEINSLRVGVGAFIGCTNLESVILRNSSLGSHPELGVFMTCPDLASVTSENTDLGDYTFYGCERIGSVSVHGGSMGNSAFAAANPSSLTLDGGVRIGDRAFASYSGASLDLSGAYEIGAYAFAAAPLTELSLSGVSRIGDGAFRSALCEIAVPAGAEVGFNGWRQTVIFAFEEGSRYSLSDGIISESTPGKPTLRFVYLGEVCGPDKVLDLSRYMPDPAFVFYDPSTDTPATFKKIIVNPDTTEIVENQFLRCNVEEIEMTGVRSIGDSAFQGSTVRTVAFGTALETIGEKAFFVCVNLESSPPESVLSLGNYALARCESLETALMPNTVSVGAYAFQLCTGLRTVSLGGFGNWGAHCFESCTSLTSVTMTGTTVPTRAFKGCASITEVTAPNLKTVGAEAFMSCRNLTYVPGSPDRFLDGAFSYSGVTEFAPSKSVVLGEGAFACSAVTRVDMSGTIGPRAFERCGDLTYVRISSGTIGNSAFKDCGVMASPEIGEVTSVGADAFAGCTGMTEIRLPSVKTVGKNAFQGCTLLASVSLSASMTTLNSDAFVGCTDLKEISVHPDNEKYRSEGGAVYLKADGKLFALAAGVRELHIGEECTGVQGLGTDKVALRYADSLRHISVSPGNGAFSSENGLLLSKDGTKLLYIPMMMQTATVPSSVTSVGDYVCHGCTTKVAVPYGEGDLEIGARSFARNEHLAEISVERGGDVTVGALTLPDVRLTVRCGGHADLSGHFGHVDAEAGTMYVHKLQEASSTKLKAGSIELSEHGLPSGSPSSYTKPIILDGEIVAPAAFHFTYDDLYTTLYLTRPNQDLLDKLGSSRVYTVGHDFDDHPRVVGRFMMRDGEAVLPSYTGAGRDAYAFVPEGFSAALSPSGGGLSVALSSDMGYLASDLTFRANGTEMAASEGLEYQVPFGVDLVIEVSVNAGGQPLLVAFDPSDGSSPEVVTVPSGMSILPGDFPVPHRPGHRLTGWYVDEGCTEEYVRGPVTSDLTLYAGWESTGPSVSVDAGKGTFYSGGAVYAGSVFSGPLTLEFVPRSGYVFLSWGDVDASVCTCAMDGTTITITSLSADMTLSPALSYVSPSMEIASPLTTEMQTSGPLVPSWEFGSTRMSMSGMVWQGMPSIPLIVDDRVYVRAGGVIYALSVEDGRVLHHAESSNDVGYYHTIGYADGKILDSVTGKVFDLDLGYLYSIPAPVSYAEFHNGYLYAFAEGRLMKLSTEPGKDLDGNGVKIDLQDPAIEGVSPYGAWGQTIPAQFEGDYVYTLQAVLSQQSPDYGKIFVCAAKLSTGETARIELEEQRHKYIDDTGLTFFGGSLYVTTYGKGIFSESTAPDKVTTVAWIKADGLDLGEPVYVPLRVEFEGRTIEATGYASNFVVSKGRGFMSAGGAVFLFDLDPDGRPSINRIVDGFRGRPYIVGVTGHGGITVDDRTDADGFGPVYLFKVPYKPLESVYVYKFVFHTDGKITGSSQMMPCTAGNYGSQAVRAGPGGEMIYYNDDGLVHCYRSLAKDPFRVLVLDDDADYAFSHAGTLKEAFASDPSLLLDPYGTVQRNGERMNVFALAADGTWIKIANLNAYSQTYTEEYGMTMFFSRTFVVAKSAEMPPLGEEGGAGWYGIAGGRALRLDIADPSSVAALDRKDLAWMDSAPTGIVAPSKKSVAAGTSAGFSALSPAGDIAWRMGDPSIASAEVSDGGRTVVLTGIREGTTVLHGSSGAYRFSVAVTVLPDNVVINPDGSTTATEHAAETHMDGTSAEIVSVRDVSADGGTVSERVTVTYRDSAGRVTGYRETVTTSSALPGGSEVYTTVSLKDAAGNTLSQSESFVRTSFRTEADGTYVTESEETAQDGGGVSEIRTVTRSKDGRTETVRTEERRDPEGVLLFSEEVRTVSTGTASAVMTKRVEGGRTVVRTVVSGDVAEAAGLASGMGAGFLVASGGSLGKAELEAVAAAGGGLEISFGDMRMDVSPGDVGRMAAAGDVTASFAETPLSGLPSEWRGMLKGRTVYDITLTAGGKAFRPGSPVKVALPFSGDPADLAVWYLDDGGRMHRVGAEFFDGMAVFETDHFSYYVVGEASGPAASGDGGLSETAILIVAAMTATVAAAVVFATVRD